MGHVAIPYEWKEFLFHGRCSFNVTSILTSGLIFGGRESKDGRQTIFFTPLDPFGDNADEGGPGDDLSKPRQVHYYSKWHITQDAVYFVNFARAHDNGLRFWKTSSTAVIENKSVPADCTHRVISQTGKRTLFEGLSTPRPAPKIVFECAWQSQQQQQDTYVSASSRTRQLVRRVEREQGGD